MFVYYDKFTESMYNNYICCSEVYLSTCNTDISSQFKGEAPPPQPPSRSSSIRLDPSPATNPPRPPPTHPRPPPRQSYIPNETTFTNVAALKQAMFGEKKSSPPAVPQKSTIKPLQNKMDNQSMPSSVHHNIAQKSSVLKIAAALESSQRNIDEGQPEVKTEVANPTSQHSVEQTHISNVNKFLTLNQQSEKSFFPPGAPYEVPKQGNVVRRSTFKTSSSTPYTSNANHDRSPPQEDMREAEQGSTRSQTDFTLASALQVVLSKRSLQNSKSETEAEKKQHPQQDDGQSTFDPPSSANSRQQETSLLVRIRQHKAQKMSNDILAGDTDGKRSQPVQRTPSNLSVKSNQFAEERNKSPLLNSAADRSKSEDHHSTLCRSSSNLSRRISDENALDDSSVHTSQQSRKKSLHRSLSLSKCSVDGTAPVQSSGFNHANAKNRIKRTSSNLSRQSTEESVPQLPKRPVILADTNQGQTTGIDRDDQTMDLNCNQQYPPPQDSSNKSSSVVDESMVLADFISRYSGALPFAVSVQYMESVASKRLIATAQCNSFNVHFLKHSKVVVVRDYCGVECFSVPFSSSVKFGLVYDQKAFVSCFETAGDIMGQKQLPYVVCATKHFDGGSHEKSVMAGEILFIRGVKKSKTIGRGKVLKVNSINGDEKLLGSKCCGGFTTSPHDCQLSLSSIMEHSIPFPQQALVFGEGQVGSYLPDTMVNHPVTLEKVHKESSAIMTPRYSDNAQKDDSWMYDVSTKVKLWVKKLPISKENQEDLSTESNVFYNTFDPRYVQHYTDKKDDNGIALQHVLFINLLQGKEKEGVHLYLPSAGMIQEFTNEDLKVTTANESYQRATYAVHIFEQQNSVQRDSSSVEQEDVTGITSANMESAGRSNNVPPTEVLRVEQDGNRDGDGEDAYEEVMAALEAFQGENTEPRESPKIGKLLGVFEAANQSLTKVHKENESQQNVSHDVPIIKPASTSPEPDEDYDGISFAGYASENEELPNQSELPPPLPGTSQITGRRPPQIALPPPPHKEIGSPSIAIQRLMAAAKISSVSTASDTEQVKQDREQDGFQTVPTDDEIFEDEESGYSNVRSLGIPSVIAAKQSSIAAVLSKRKPPLHTAENDENQTTILQKITEQRSIDSAYDQSESKTAAIPQPQTLKDLSVSESTGDYVKLHWLYSELQMKTSEMMNDISEMKAQIEELSHTVKELVQTKQDSLQTQTLPRNKKFAKHK